MVDIHSKDGEQIRHFFGIQTKEIPIVFIVRDDDTLDQKWPFGYMPTTNEVARRLREIGGTGRQLTQSQMR
jgi:hypothetical protein